jgi:hypothetical protein
MQNVGTSSATVTAIPDRSLSQDGSWLSSQGQNTVSAAPLLG